MFKNILSNPRTSIAGLLIGIVTIAGVLSQQGITLGTAGTGTVVSLIAGVAAALLGLLAKDPGSSTPGAGSTQRLGVIMLCALLITLPMTACSGVTVAQDIVNWTPSLQAAVATIDSTAAILLPTDAPIFIAATAGFDAASNLLVGQAKAYLANPTASVLAQLQIQAVTFQQQVNAAVLKVAGIKDPASQQHALSAIGVVVTVVNAIIALVQSISSKAAVASMAQASTIKLAQVEPYLNRTQAYAIVRDHDADSTPSAAYRAIYEVDHGLAQLQSAGF